MSIHSISSKKRPSPTATYISSVVQDDKLRPVEAGLPVGWMGFASVVLLVEEIE